MYENAVQVVREYLEERGIKSDNCEIWSIVEDDVLPDYRYMLTTSLDDITIYDLYYGRASHSWELRVYKRIDCQRIDDY